MEFLRFDLFVDGYIAVSICFILELLYWGS